MFGSSPAGNVYMISEEEFTKNDIEEKIELFQNGINVLKQSIKNKYE